MKKILTNTLVAITIFMGAFGVFANSVFAQAASAANIEQAGIPDVTRSILDSSQTVGQPSTSGPVDPTVSGTQNLYNQAATAKTNSINRDVRGAQVGQCNWSSPFQCIGIGLLMLGGKLLYVAGIFLNFAINISIVQMSQIVNNTGAINAGWKVIRDMANMFFIFVLVYIAVRTILGMSTSQTKELVANVIIVALFINFSLFFTKVIIDASNIVTIQFYNSISKGETAESGLSWTFMNISHLTSIYPSSNSSGQVVNDIGSESNMLLIGFMGLIFAAILSLTFFAIGIMFVIRLAVLLFLLMLSPLAFLAWAVPGSKLHSAWDSWWHSLIDQALFAPVMMVLLWIVAGVMNDTNFANALHIDGNFSFANALGSAPTSSSAAVFVNFGLLIAMLFGALTIAKKMGATGAGAVMGWADKWSRQVTGNMTAGTVAFTGRKTLGWIGNKASSSPTLQKFAASNPTLGGLVYKGAKKAATANFDARSSFISGLGEAGGKGGYKGVLDEQIKGRQEMAKNFKDVKIYSDPAIERLAKTEEDIKKKRDQEVLDYNKRIEELRKNGIKNEEDVKKLEDLERQKASAIVSRGEAEKRLKTIQEDQSKTKTGEQVFGQQLTKGPIAAIMKRIAAEREKSQKKIEEPYTKDRQKQEGKFADEYRSTALQDQIAKLNEALKNVGTSANSNDEIVELQKKIEEHTKKSTELQEKIYKGQGTIKDRVDRDAVLRDTEILKKNLENLKADTSLAVEMKKNRLTKERDALEKELKSIKNKNASSKLRETLKEIDGSANEKTDDGAKGGEAKH